MNRTCPLFTILMLAMLIGGNSLKAQSAYLAETPEDKSQRMQWFKDAKLGIFIHWGIYAVNGISESWSFYNQYISHTDYMKQLDGFTAANYNPNQWADIIHASGAKYVVITSKHHDGVALWNTSQEHLSVVQNTPAANDLLSPFVKAIRKKNLKLGLYYSLIDWSHPDYPNFTRTQKRYEDDSTRWSRFYDFNHAQIEELSDAFRPDLFWFDGDWEFSAEEWGASVIREKLLKRNKNVIMNNRLKEFGDYATPENGLPVFRPKDSYWELCLTMNDSWGFQPNDSNYKSSSQIITIFADCIGNGGNLLLDIGPDAVGNIPPEQISILNDLGRWTNKHEQAIFGSNAGISKDLYYGSSTLSADSTILYLFMDSRSGTEIMLKGIKNEIHRVWVLGNGTQCKVETFLKPYWSDKPGLVIIEVPKHTLDAQLTVVAVLLDGKIQLIEED